jgi:hypothetical protein
MRSFRFCISVSDLGIHLLDIRIHYCRFTSVVAKIITCYRYYTAESLELLFLLVFRGTFQMKVAELNEVCILYLQSLQIFYMMSPSNVL